MNENYNTSKFRFHIDTPFVYNRIYEFDFTTKTPILLEDFELSGPKFAHEKYEIKQINAFSKDGTEIPITLICKKNLKLTRKNKLLLHGYGHYGLPMEVGFNISYLSALENDWVLAYAHVRGGNEKGNKWHEAGKLENKISSYTEYVACAEYLIA